MIRRRTILVLGAGGSKPYGFPIGVQLVDQICQEILDGTPLITRLENLLERLGGTPGDAARFAGAMRGARTYSIDAFLETNRRFREIGKAAIADVLLRAEDPKKLETAPENSDWYRYLINTLVRRNTDHFLSQAKRLTVVTFNFDRSFERALFSALRHSFGLDAGPARQLATELRIHHVHGSLGKPDWLYPDDPNSNPYGVSDDTLVQAVRPPLRRRATGWSSSEARHPQRAGGPRDLRRQPGRRDVVAQGTAAGRVRLPHATTQGHVLE